MTKALLALSAAIFAVYSVPVSAGQPSSTETVEVTEGGNAVGAAALVRKKQSASFRINTTMLDPNSAYTIWVAAFNNPEDCLGECDGPDIPLTDGSLFFGSAFVTGIAGTANVEFDILAGNLPEGTNVAAGQDKGINRGNGFKVELHLVIAQHGPSSDILDWPFELSSPGPAEQVALFK